MIAIVVHYGIFMESLWILWACNAKNLSLTKWFSDAPLPHVVNHTGLDSATTEGTTGAGPAF